VEADVIGGTLGDFDLNQQVYTMMSYEDGWQTSPYGLPDSTAGYGFIGSVMAMDIAVLQDKYGVNEDTATGNDVYVLPDDNHTATFDADGNLVSEATGWKSIWDAGGTDSMIYNGSKDTNIDLRPATLRYEVGGGGWLSYAYGVFGGFTIANSVTIENATSGSGNDTLIGNDAANRLDGGQGNDVMTGGGGNDTYIVRNAGDQIVEAAGQGTDAAYFAVNYKLAAGISVETLAVAFPSETAGIDLAGNAVAQTLLGSAGSNTLDGGGGGDVLRGFAGNDVYIVRNAGDQIVETAGQGTDAAYATVNYTLAAGSSVETLAVAFPSETAGIDLTGNAFAQALVGSAGDNTLDGGGGADTLRGLGGHDSFAFTTALGGGNVDTILDFVAADDQILLDDAVFAGLGLGALSAGAFRTGTTALDADDRILYDSATGRLFFDSDGAGGAAAVQFATLSGHPALSVSDFTVI